MYVDGSKAIAFQAPSDAPGGQQFKYWVVQTWNESDNAYEDTDTKVYPGEAFYVLKANAHMVVTERDDEGEIKTATYTVQLRAFYGPIESAEKTTIQYCPNYE